MRRFCFVHAADLHLDQPFEGVGRTPPAIAAALCDASVHAWDELVRLCVAREAVFLLLGGGLFGPDLGIRAQARLRRGLLRLGEHAIQTFIALGPDEDDCRRWFAEQDWPSSLTVFATERPGACRVVRDGRHLATVVGQSADGDWSLDDFLAALPPRDAAPVIALVPRAAASLDLERAARPGAPAAVDYWALGGAAGTSRHGFHPWVVEPGPLQARAALARHLGPRGAMVADVGDDKVVAAELAELDHVRWLRVEIALPRHTQPRDEIVAELLELRAAHAGRGLLVDVVLTGSARAWSLAERAALLDAVRAATRDWDPFVWGNSLRVPPREPALPEDTWSRDELATAVLQSGRALLGNPLRRSYFIANHCEALLRRWNAEMDVDATEHLLHDATCLAVDRLLDARPS